MGAIGGLFFIAFIYVVVSAVVKGSTSAYDRLVAQGTPARGILLQVATTGTRVPALGKRPFERRQMVVDVEIPGQPPYEVNAAPLVPLNLIKDALPGATVELRVHPRDRTQLAIVGPGAFFASQLLGQQRSS